MGRKAPKERGLPNTRPSVAPPPPPRKKMMEIQPSHLLEIFRSLPVADQNEILERIAKTVRHNPSLDEIDDISIHDAFTTIRGLSKVLDRCGIDTRMHVKPY